MKSSFDNQEIIIVHACTAAGNRLSQEIRLPGGEPVTTGYTYDEANRLTRVGEQAYTWDANGNLLDDGQRQYGYDAANRLVALTEGEVNATYTYNGLGDRVRQSVNGVTENYQLDLYAELTQVLSDGTATYLYGLGRVSQESGDEVGLFLPDGLGSVRTVVAGGKSTWRATMLPTERSWPGPGRGRPSTAMLASGRTGRACSTCGPGVTTRPWEDLPTAI